MKELTADELKKSYSELNTEALADLDQQGGLTEFAQKVLQKVLYERKAELIGSKDLIDKADKKRPAPTFLKVIAVLFLMVGVFSAMEITFLLMRGEMNIGMRDGISINLDLGIFGILGMFIGPGLLNLNRGARKCALVVLWINFIIFPIAALASLTVPYFFIDFNSKYIFIHAVVFALLAALFLLSLWTYRFLTSLEVRKLFKVDELLPELNESLET
jgi:hypothetical protein